MAADAVSHTWLLPDEPVAVRLMSTIWMDAEGMHDELAAPRDVDAWLDAVGVDLGGTEATTAEFMKARELRDAIRLLAGFVTTEAGQAAGTALGEALRQVNAAAAQAPAPALMLRGSRFERGCEARVSPVTAGLARVAADAIGLLGGDAARLRACGAPGCVLYFVKTHPRREWCSVACGNRVRAARHYQRVRTLR
jgi:predicted RNA-binding Zn ribbon-like protein